MTTDPEKRAAQQRRWYEKNGETHRTNMRSRRKDLRVWYRELKSGHACQRCREDDPRCLDFHHHGGDKDFSLANALKRGLSRERILAEVAKCIVLCANCHRKTHTRVD